MFQQTNILKIHQQQLKIAIHAPVAPIITLTPKTAEQPKKHWWQKLFHWPFGKKKNDETTSTTTTAAILNNDSNQESIDSLGNAASSPPAAVITVTLPIVKPKRCWMSKSTGICQR